MLHPTLQRVIALQKLCCKAKHFHNILCMQPLILSATLLLGLVQSLQEHTFVFLRACMQMLWLQEAICKM